MQLRLLAALACLLVSVAAVAAADWSQFRGPGGSGVSDAKGTPLNWSDTQGIVWKTELPGPGTSSPTVFGNKIFLTCYTGVTPERGGSLDDFTLFIAHQIALSQHDLRIFGPRSHGFTLVSQSSLSPADCDKVSAWTT